MDVKVDISPEKVEQAVINAIVESSIGKQLSEAVTKALSPEAHTRKENGKWHVGNAVQAAVTDVVMVEVRKLATQMVHDRKEEIREKILEHLTGEALGNVVSSIWTAVQEKLEKIEVRSNW